MIRLIASDIDGTLLPYGGEAIDPAIYREIRRLREKGILFCPASGRQYNSLRGLFAPVADELVYLCENGAIVYGAGNPGPVLGKTVMDRSLAEALSEDIMSMENCEVMISGASTCYICPRYSNRIEKFMTYAGYRYTAVSSPSQVPEEIIKVSLFCPEGAAEKEPEIAPRWRKHFNAAIAGAMWLDFTLADKGTGITQLCKVLDIPLADTMAFGDNYNDLAMLGIVGHPYLMASAAPELLPRVSNHCSSVLEVLETL